MSITAKGKEIMVKIDVCIGSACHLKGAYSVIQLFQQYVAEYGVENDVELQAVFCLGHCTNAVSVQLDDGEVTGVLSDTARDFFEQKVLPQTCR